jgi:hypothetical protein
LRERIVPFREQPYPPETLAMMYRVLDECVDSLVDGHKLDPSTLDGIRLRFAQLILGAVADGENDPETLKRIVLREFNRTDK